MAKHTEGIAEDDKKMSSGNKVLADTEGEASVAFAARREHEAVMKRLDILQNMIQKSGTKIDTSQENTTGMSADNEAVTQFAHPDLEVLQEKLAEVTATSLQKLEQA